MIVRITRTNKQKKNIFGLSMLLLVIFLIILFFLPGQNIYQTDFSNGRPSVADAAINLAKPAPYPVNFTGIQPPELTAHGVLVVDMVSSIKLFEKNSNLKLSPASTTKIMTALVSLETYKLDEILTIKTVITEGKVMGLIAGDKFTTENLLYGTLVDSGNDAAYALAENFPGGMEKFVQKMNQRAKELSLKETNFTNPIGFEDDNHYTTARDLVKLATVALNNSQFAKMVSIPSITVSNINYTRFYPLTNVNELLGKIPGVLGVKTGWTKNSGECLVTAVIKNDQKILIVVLGSNDRFGETKTLIDWVYNNFLWKTIDLPNQD